MTTTSLIAPAIEACYNAAFEFSRWPYALQALADSLGATSCVIRCGDPTHPYRSDQRHRTLPTPDSTEHAEFAALWMERVEGAPDLHAERMELLAKPATCFFVEDEITTTEERESLPYYQDIARPGNRQWWASLRFVVNNRKWCLPMYRDARRGPFEKCEADHLLRIAPDLSRIISVAEKIWDNSAASSLAALDRLNCGAILLDCRGCVTRLNKKAENLLGSDLMVHHGRIRASDRASDARLQGLIASAVSISPAALNGTGPVVIGRNGSPWLLAEVVPMTSFVHDLFNGGDILLYFTVIVAERIPSERLLSQTFQLTAAEARLASSLAAGEGISAASTRLAISRETARTQLRAIFAKTGTRRQAELTALLSRLDKSTRQ